jgi:hypothetical protein
VVRRSPTCWRGYRSNRAAAGDVAGATTELGLVELID